MFVYTGFLISVMFSRSSRMVVIVISCRSVKRLILEKGIVTNTETLEDEPVATLNCKYVYVCVYHLYLYMYLEIFGLPVLVNHFCPS